MNCHTHDGCGDGWFIQPNVIFLDEPLSGLDSSTALQIIKLLKTICTTGMKTVCMTVHQPSIQVYNCMDEVMFLHRGGIMYTGTPLGIVNYIENNTGKIVPPFSNVAELFLEYLMEFNDRDGEELNRAQALKFKHTSTTEGSFFKKDSYPKRQYANNLVIYLLYILRVTIQSLFDCDLQSLTL